jgi:hypothetical protein
MRGIILDFWEVSGRKILSNPYLIIDYCPHFVKVYLLFC